MKFNTRVGESGQWAIALRLRNPGANGRPYAPTAQNATPEGVHVARNIMRGLRGEELQEFRYTPISELALMGKKRGVARIYGHNFAV
jgi:NADH dehydrogenase